MFSPFQDTNSLLLKLVGVLLAIAVIFATARQPRRTALVLSGLAVALVALTILAITILVSLRVQRLPGNRLLAWLLALILLADGISPIPALAAWAVSLWRAAKMGHWGWFVGLLPFVLLSLIGPLFAAHPELILGQAAATQLITSSFYNSWVFLFSVLTAQLLTPLAALVYGIVTPDKESQTQPRTAQLTATPKHDEANRSGVP